MAQPTWVTGSGSLGTIPEGKFYRATLQAYDPDFPSDATKVKYLKISGDLPKGIQINQNGTLEGTPKAYLQGIPNEVSQNVTSKFSVRVYTERIENGDYVLDKLNDRTFELTVTGQDKPQFDTPAGNIGNYFDGQLVNYQIETSDADPNDTLEVDLVSGELPPGVSVDTDGLIYGYIAPATEIEIDSAIAIAGWENTGFDDYPLQFNQGTISRTYEFTLRVSDGNESSLRSFNIYVGITTADSTAFTVDSDKITVDAITRAPFIKNYVKNIGSYTHKNFFSFKFEGYDHNGDTLAYSQSPFSTVDSTLLTVDRTTVTTDSTSNLPGGLTLDPDTGYLYGTLSDIGATEKKYSFSITVFKKENPVSAQTFDYEITITGDINSDVTWNTESNLGTLFNGEISELYVSASAVAGSNLQYRLVSGENNSLPQGLSLTTNGNIIGRVSFASFRIVDAKLTADSNTTVDTTLVTADENGSDVITFDGSTTTFDSKYTFTVEAYNSLGTVSTKRTFNIVVDNKNDKPYQQLSVQAFLSDDDRSIVNSLLGNQDVFKNESLYRPDDPYFGLAKEVSYIHAYGLSPELIEHYVESVEYNHYDKQLILGEIKTARALDSNGNVLYEVVYSSLVDKNKNANRSLTSEAGTVYPNSLDNMRDAVIDKIGQESSILPKWMLSKQEDGRILGFTPAWVLAYTKPGQAKTVAYNVDKQNISLNAIDFRADRYVLDRQTIRTWDTEDQRFKQTYETTFDIHNHSISADRTDYTADTTSYTADKVNGVSTKTIFDGNSLKFIEVKVPTTDITTKTADTITITADNGYVDYKIYTKTSKFNKYILFPKTDIINSK